VGRGSKKNQWRPNLTHGQTKQEKDLTAETTKSRSAAPPQNEKGPAKQEATKENQVTNEE
jgi:hypothetical protein